MRFIFWSTREPHTEVFDVAQQSVENLNLKFMSLYVAVAPYLIVQEALNYQSVGGNDFSLVV